MRIVIPISAHDAGLLEQFLLLLRHFGRLENHSITFAPAQSVMHLAEEAAAQIGDLTNEITVLPLAFEGEGTWPQSPNLHWAMTMEALTVMGNKEPTFWMELDCTPAKSNWADLLETDWRKGRQPFCGKIVPKPSRNAAGAIVFEPDDLMMMGCGIYPPAITHLKNWDALMKGIFSGTNAEPFDVFLRGWMRAFGWTATELIGDRWNTVNYREGMLCDPGPTEFKNRDHSRTDISAACVVHGCKDGSLGRLILEGTTAIIPPSSVPKSPPMASGLRNFSTRAQEGAPAAPHHPAPAAPPAPHHPAPAPAPQGNPEFERHVLESLASIGQSVRLFGQGLAALSATVKEALENLKQPPAEIKIVDATGTAPETAPLELVESSEAPQAPAKPKPADIADVRASVSANPKAQRIGQLAKTLKMNEERLRKMILKPDSGLIIRKGYVRMKDAA